MPRKTEPPKRPISLTLSAANLAALEEMTKKQEFRPSVSQLVDLAIREFLERRTSSAEAKRKK